MNYTKEIEDLKDKVANLITYSEYLATHLEKSIQYSEYLAEQLETQAKCLDSVFKLMKLKNIEE